MHGSLLPKIRYDIHEDLMNGQNELVVFLEVFLGHGCFFSCCARAHHGRYMSAITRNLKFQKEGDYPPFIHSMSIQDQKCAIHGAKFGDHKDK